MLPRFFSSKWPKLLEHVSLSTPPMTRNQNFDDHKLHFFHKNTNIQQQIKQRIMSPYPNVSKLHHQTQSNPTENENAGWKW